MLHVLATVIAAGWQGKGKLSMETTHLLSCELPCTPLTGMGRGAAVTGKAGWDPTQTAPPTRSRENQVVSKTLGLSLPRLLSPAAPHTASSQVHSPKWLPLLQPSHRVPPAGRQKREQAHFPLRGHTHNFGRSVG